MKIVFEDISLTRIENDKFNIVKNNIIVGTSNIFGISSGCKSFMITYFIDEVWRNQGIATKVVKAILQYAGTIQVEEVNAQVNIDNFPSRKVMDKVGFVQKSIISMNRNGKVEEVILYSFTFKK